MSLYDDLDSKARTTEKVAAWSSGIKLLQSQMLLKKAAVTQPKRESMRRSAQVLPPVIDLKSKQKEEEEVPSIGSPVIHPKPVLTAGATNLRDFDWNVVGEYDPLWPNDYEKVVIEMKERRERKEREEDRNERIEKKRKTRFGDSDDVVPEKQMIPMVAEEEEPEEKVRRISGAAIAPPPSLQESTPPPQPPPADKPAGGTVGGYSASSIAAKIMAKYGFKEGQGLGKKEQGMSVALQVEKTSKRGGRIIHEKDGGAVVMPPPPTFAVPALPGPDSPVASSETQQPAKPEPSITEIMKSPSKVVLLRNMVGPGDVDEDLEPEVKDECNTKYGDVVKVVIYEIPGVPADEGVRIFVEFKRIETAIKAVVDLNGRFFGGRQVKAGFYSVEKFNAYKLLE